LPYLLDSDLVIDYLENVPSATELVSTLAGDRLAMSAITYMEAYEGTLSAANPDVAQAKPNDFTVDVRVVPFDRRTAIVAASLRRELRAKGMRVNQRANDLNRAATALAHGLTLVTRNRRDFADTGVDILPYA
jgi:predicted nucleic acid-binding protein